MPARAACPQPVAPDLEATLFAFNALIYAASSVASAGEAAELGQFLLVHQPNDGVDRAYPVRRSLATAVDSWPLQVRRRALTYLLGHKAAATNFNALVLQLVGPPPMFTQHDQEVPGGDNERLIFNHRARLSAVLREIWRAGDLETLWRRLGPSWQQHQLCRPHVQQIQAKVAQYLRWNSPVNMQGSVVITNPLMPPGSGVTCVYADGHFVMLVGPTASSRDQAMLVAHELSHPLLNDLFKTDRRLRAALGESACVFDAISSEGHGNVLTRHVYTTWESYFAETLVRIIARRVVASPDPVSASFAVAPSLEAQLARYETSHLAFADAALGALAKLRQEFCTGTEVVNIQSAPPVRFFKQ